MIRSLRSAAFLASTFLAAAVVGCGADAPSAENAGDVASAPRRAPSVWTSGAPGFDTHSYWVDTGREVVVFDAQFTEALARDLLAAIRAETANPIAYVVVTHPNPDKFNGLSVFRQAGAKSVASTATARAIPGVHAYKKNFFVNVAKMMDEAAYPSEPVIDLTFDERLELPVAGETIALEVLPHAGVSSTQTVAHLVDRRALIVGDLVHHGVHAWLEGGIVDGAPRPDLAAWSAALGDLEAFGDVRVYGGRGVPAKVGAAVADQRAYLEAAGVLVRDYVRDLGDRRAELSGPDAGAHFAAIRQRLEARFPARGLGYLVEYGVYGLALADAAGPSGG